MEEEKTYFEEKAMPTEIRARLREREREEEIERTEIAIEKKLTIRLSNLEREKKIIETVGQFWNKNRFDLIEF